MLITEQQALKPFDAPHRVWQGIPGIVRTKGGRTFVSAYSGNVKETYGNFVFLIADNGNADWQDPIAVVRKEGDFRCFDPVLWIDPLDRLWLIWNVMPGEEVRAVICENPDAAVLQWSEEIYIGRGVMMNKPVVLTSGEWLFPIAFWKKDIYREMRESAYRKDDESGAFVYKTSDNGKSFIKLGGVNMRDRSFDEHMVMELENGVLMMLVRTNYGIGVSYSYDRGNHWNMGADSNLGGPCSRFHITKLRSGRVLLINHCHFEGRNNLTALLSEDDGKTYPYSLMLDERRSVSYPDAMESQDGFIDIVYDRERGCFKSSLEEVYSKAREILTARITEEDILRGAITTEGSFLKRVVSKLDRLAPEIGDPFDESGKSDYEIAKQLMNEADVMKAVFERYPIDCIDVHRMDEKKLDALIAQFQQSEEKNIEDLEKIIRFLRQFPTTEPNASPIIRMAKNYIDERLNDDLSLTEIADDLNISVYYLSHIFKSETGITLMEYRNEMRMTQAKKLLLQTELGIAEIAGQVGFANASYFSKTFSKRENVSPMEYRKYHKHS